MNGRSVNAGLLREISEFLIDIHGQSEHLSLLQVNQHIFLLDRYAALQPGSKLPERLGSYSSTYKRLIELRRELNEFRKSESDAARQTDMLNFQIQEIEAARLRTGEDEELREERNRLANAENLTRLTQEAIVALDEGAPESPAASDLLGNVVEKLSDLIRLDPSQNSLLDLASSLFDGLNDLSRDLRRYIENVEFNPKRLDQVEERLALIQLLKRKYGDSIQAVLAFGENAKHQRDLIAHAEERIKVLEAEEDQLLLEIGRKGSELSQEREKAAELLARAIEAELADLHMTGAHFRVDIQQSPDDGGAMLEDGRKLAYSSLGLEKVEFMIAPNPGEGFKPLVKIASGGETSRLMLALKNVLAQADHVPTLIFDEIDQGIGGRVGAIVGKKLKQLGRKHQVLCITHLPQLAAYGDQHFRVEKQIQDGRTTTKVLELGGEERLLELAQMLGGISEGTLQSARELLENTAVRDNLSDG